MLVGVDFDIVVANAVGREESDYRAGGEPFFLDDPFQHGFGVYQQFSGFLADDFIFENSGVFAGQFPGGEKRRPVDALHQFGQRVVVESQDDAAIGALDPYPVVEILVQRGGSRRLVVVPVDTDLVLPGVGERDGFAGGLLARPPLADRGVFGLDARLVGFALVVGEQLAGDADGARSVRDIHHRVVVTGVDLDGGMHPGGCRAADQ